MHTEHLPADQPVGARRGPGSDARAPGTHAAGLAMAAPDRGARLRDDQIVGGFCSSADQDHPEGANGDQLVRSGIQHEAGDADSGGATADAGDEGLKGLGSSKIYCVRASCGKQPHLTGVRQLENVFPHNLGRERLDPVAFGDFTFAPL